MKLRNSGVLLVGATNFMDRLDAAAVREGRFDYKVEVSTPDAQARQGLLQAGVDRYAAHLRVDGQEMRAVAQRWNGFSVARLQAVCQALPDVASKHRLGRIGLAEWGLALRTVQGNAAKVAEGSLELADLVLPAECRGALELMAARLQDVARVEALGGTVPTGVLFHGEPGTGKTVAAKALAKASGWAFLAVSGADLVADGLKLDALLAQAKDLRPAIIFIDEADDMVRNRQFSARPDMVNKLLTLMDGAGEKVKDLLWLAATNHPHEIDPALLRAGRFTEKVAFTPPPAWALQQHMARWLSARNVQTTSTLGLQAWGTQLAGQTVANVEGVLQYALNVAIARTAPGESVALTDADLGLAMGRVLMAQDEAGHV